MHSHLDKFKSGVCFFFADGKTLDTQCLCLSDNPAPSLPLHGRPERSLACSTKSGHLCSLLPVILAAAWRSTKCVMITKTSATRNDLHFMTQIKDTPSFSAKYNSGYYKAVTVNVLDAALNSLYRLPYCSSMSLIVVYTSYIIINMYNIKRV